MVQDEYDVDHHPDEYAQLQWQRQAQDERAHSRDQVQFCNYIENCKVDEEMPNQDTDDDEVEYTMYTIVIDTANANV